MFSLTAILRAMKALRAAYGRYSWHIVLLTVLGVVIGALEGIGVNALIPLLAFATGGASSDNFILDAVRGSFDAAGIPFTLKFLLIFVCALFVVRAAVSVAAGAISAWIIGAYEERTRTILLRETLAASWPHLLKQKVGHLDTILMLDIKKSAALLEQIAGTLSSVGTLAMYVVVAVNINASVTGLTLALGVVSFLGLKPLLGKTRRLSQETTVTNRAVAHLVNENIIGAKTIKALAGEDAVVRAGRALFVRLKRLQIIGAVLKKTVGAASQPIGIILISAVFAIFYGRTDFNFAAMLAIMYLIQRMFLYVQLLQNGLQGIAEHVPYLESIAAYEKDARRNAENGGGQAPFAFTREIAFSGVFFSYAADAPLLRDADLVIKKGEMIGLVGPSGAGKTTVADLLLRFYKPDRGVITVDGRSIEEIDLGAWRRSVGYVSQDVFLKNDTIARNIVFFDDTVSEADVKRAAHLANLDEVIARAPKEFDTPLGERGVLFSGGQRQRVALARVLARRPEVLILDEATSALDAESEATIREAINTLKGKITMIIIAHRRETLSSCDRLLALEEGRVVEKKYE